jgi:cephalosporin hydroxylase
MSWHTQNAARLGEGFRLMLSSPEQFADRVRRMLRGTYRAHRPMRRDYRDRFSMTLREWLLYHQRAVLFNQCSWMGVPALKNPLDAWVYQELIHHVRPDVIVEIGSAQGGSTLYFANLLDLLGSGSVISIDVDRSRFAVDHPRIITITGNSSAPETIEQVAQLCANKSVLVVHDGNHEKPQVLNDLRAYASLVPVGGYLIVEDGIIDLYNPGDGIGTMEDGPLAAIEEFITHNSQFVVDTRWERYILTYNPRGFLLRIR